VCLRWTARGSKGRGRGFGRRIKNRRLNDKSTSWEQGTKNDHQKAGKYVGLGEGSTRKRECWAKEKKVYNVVGPTKRVT